jgi:hypothetical protein
MKNELMSIEERQRCGFRIEYTNKHLAIIFIIESKRKDTCFSQLEKRTKQHQQKMTRFSLLICFSTQTYALYNYIYIQRVII